LRRYSKKDVLKRSAFVVLLAGNMGWAQGTIQPQDRLREAITESSMTARGGNVHPALAHATSAVAVDASFPMEHMILLLQPDRAQPAALDELVAQQQDTKSSQFHKFLSPGQFAARFGASQNDMVQNHRLVAGRREIAKMANSASSYPPAAVRSFAFRRNVQALP
jgi:hypothetical protein